MNIEHQTFNLQRSTNKPLPLAIRNGIEDFVLKASHRGGDVIAEAEGIVLEEGAEVEGEGKARGAVGVVGLEEGGVRGLTGDHGLMVVFSAGDLGIETGVELVGEFREGAGIEGDFFVVVEPIEVAPEFTGVEFAGAGMGREAAARLEGGAANCEVGGMFVGGVMGVADFGLGFEEPVCELRDAGFAGGGIFDGLAGMVEAFDEAVLPEVGGAELFPVTGLDDLIIGIIRVGASAGTAGAVGADDATKPGEILLVTGADAVVCHKLEVVGVSADREMGTTGVGFGGGHGVGNVQAAGFRHEASLRVMEVYLKEEMVAVDLLFVAASLTPGG